jgi:hypothetical protein
VKQARVWAVFGASGTGKDAWTKQQLKKLNPKRLIVWDPMDEYGEHADRVPDLVALLKAVKPARFAWWCRICWAAGDAVCLVNECSQVTTASQAPPDWARLTTAGRHRQIHVIALSQFPAQVDKSLMGNATLIHTGHLANVRHRQAVAVEIDAEPESIRSLQDLEWLEWSRETRAIKRGRLAFKP